MTAGMMTIKGVEYDLAGVFGNPELNHLQFLKRHEGLSLKSVWNVFDKLSKQETPAEGEAPDENAQMVQILDMLSDEENLDGFRALIWLLRTSAGERTADRYMTVDEANTGVGLADIGFPQEEVPAEADPTVGALEPQS